MGFHHLIHVWVILLCHWIPSGNLIQKSNNEIEIILNIYTRSLGVGSMQYKAVKNNSSQTLNRISDVSITLITDRLKRYR